MSRSREAANTAGVMIAVDPPADVVEQLAQPDGEPLEQMHVTLGYLGDAADLDDTQRTSLIDTVTAVAALAPPIDITIAGVGRFDATDDEGNAPIAALVDSRGLTDLHGDLVDALQAAGLPISVEHGFTAHCTLAWAPPNTPLPTIDRIEFTTERLTVHIGGERTEIPLLGGEPMKRSSEALPGGRTFQEVKDLLEDGIAKANNAGGDVWVWVKDMTDEWAIYELEGSATPGCFQVAYSIDDGGVVTLQTPTKVEPRTTYEPVTESGRYKGGRVLEAKGTDGDGGKVYRVRIIESGMSRNGRNYPLPTLSAAVGLYAGAKAYDHHRSESELETSTTAGMVGHYRNPVVDGSGIDADLHLLPSAVATAEALDASLAAQDAGLPPLVGISHDVACTWQPVVADGRRFQEATKIDRVFSADVVADPAAGGRAIRSVAGGVITTLPEEDAMPTSIKDLAEQLETATDEDKAALAKALGITGEATPPPKVPESGTETDPSGTEVEDKDKELVGAGATEAVKHDRESDIVGLLVERRLKEAKLEHLAPIVTKQLPTRVSEADIRAAVESAQGMVGELEKAGLVPKTSGLITVGTEDFDKKKEKLFQSVCRNWQEGYTSFSEAYGDLIGYRGAFDADVARQMVRESIVTGVFGRATESITTSSWGEILGDSINRRLVELFKISRYSDWRKVVRTKPLKDFRTQRVIGYGGYGDLPTVAQGAPYQPLTSPADEEATYSPSKKGGTEDITWETILNDDLGVVAKIPEALSLAAARTLYKFVFVTLITGNPTLYDSTALFAAGHGNTTATALGHSGLGTVRQKMRDQTDRGGNNVLGLVPNVLIVPNELEQTAFELTKSTTKNTTNQDATVPNFNQDRYEVIVVDDLTDADDWFAMDTDHEGIEVGFVAGREDPELFVQDDPRVGSMFDADKVTYKIRHVYGGAVVDYRPFQRGTQ